MKVLNSVAVSAMLMTLLAAMLAACSHSDSGQDAAAPSQVDAKQINVQASAPVQTGTPASSSVQPTVAVQATTQQAETASSHANSAVTPQVAAPAIASTVVPVVPVSTAPTGPDRTQAMATTGCSQRSCQ